MKHEERVIKATFLTGVIELGTRLLLQYKFNYSPLWVEILGALGTGMILYSWAHSYFYMMEVRRRKS